MTEQEFTALTTASPETLWRHVADVVRWKAWDESLAKATDVRLSDVNPTASVRLEAENVTRTLTLQQLTGGTKVVLKTSAEGGQRAVDALARLGTKATPTTLAGVIRYVPNVAATVAFYERAFGLEVAMRAEGDVYVQMKGAVPLAFLTEPFAQSMVPGFVPARPSDAPAAAEVMFVFADVAAAFERAVKAGATSVMPPMTKPWGQVIAYVRDVDGALVELTTPWE